MKYLGELRKMYLKTVETSDAKSWTKEAIHIPAVLHKPKVTFSDNVTVIQ